jgi:hypothetical protein
MSEAEQFLDRKMQYVELDRDNILWFMTAKKGSKITRILGRFENQNDFQQFIKLMMEEGMLIRKVSSIEYRVEDPRDDEEIRMVRVDITPFKQEVQK